MKTAIIRLIKGCASVGVAAVVSYLADGANLTGLLNPAIATVAAGVFLVIEGYIKDKGHGALFGAVS